MWGVDDGCITKMYSGNELILLRYITYWNNGKKIHLNTEKCGTQE